MSKLRQQASMHSGGSDMDYKEALEILAKKLGPHKVWALAVCLENKPSVSTVSGVIDEGKIYFKTDMAFRKTQKMLANPHVALCTGGVQVEGLATSLGLLAQHPDPRFVTFYQKYWGKSYNAYPHKETELLFEITPLYVKMWDQRDDDTGYQIIIDLEKETAELVNYD